MQIIIILSILDFALRTHEHNYAGSSAAGGSAIKAISDDSGNNIKQSYASSLSISGQTLSLKNKNGSVLNSVTLPSSGGSGIDIYIDDEPSTPANKTIWIGD